jgi:hypothetical protein
MPMDCTCAKCHHDGLALITAWCWFTNTHHAVYLQAVFKVAHSRTSVPLCIREAAAQSFHDSMQTLCWYTIERVLVTRCTFDVMHEYGL